MAAESKPRWYRLTPDRFVIGLLLAVGAMWLSEHFRWFAFNEHKGWAVLLSVATVTTGLAIMLAWFAVALVFRRRFQFGVRSLLLFVVVVALPLSWYTVEVKRAARQRRAVLSLEQSLGGVAYEDDASAASPPPPGFTSAMTAFLKRHFDHDFLAYVSQAYVHFGPQIEYAKEFPRLKSLQIGVNQYAAANSLFPPPPYDTRFVMDLESLKDLWGSLAPLADGAVNESDYAAWPPDSSSIMPPATGSGEDCLKGIDCFTDLQSLSIFSCAEMTDRDLEHIAKLRRLQYLHLPAPCDDKNAGLSLTLGSCKITVAGIEKLRRALPLCKIAY